MENMDSTKKIYLVGGYVRDKLLHIKSKDKDYVAVGYKESDFSHLQKVGKSFPVFLLDNNSQIALARKETKLGHGYNGFSYDTENVTLLEDLKRRDLTINSIALDEDSGEIIDPFGGANDIKNKILRHTSSAFIEDPLRVLRIARFKAKLGQLWKIHKDTKALIYNMKDELKYLEPNRVYKEAETALSYKNAHLFFESLFELGVLEYIFPNIYKLTTLKESSLYHMKASAFLHTINTIKNLKYENLCLKLSALYHDIAKPHIYRFYGNSNGHDDIKLVESLIDMQIPNRLKKDILLLIQNHIKIQEIENLKASNIVRLLESYKGNLELLNSQIKLFNADLKARKAYRSIKKIDTDKLIEAFKKIKYSPKQWIESKEIPPNATQIKEHILQEKIKIIKEIF
ncbi:polynucleotide adenylyltransferase [Helicobacter sp. WB40]|uniref:Polynucleotide adenylyltransferase n=2 Tax=Helicobacteraceae TaxID=72293 RepID=A0ABT4VBN4_9HELI|nr:polynucleotide adenylyltransferase [Helicobacter sp. WB40]MDA3968109.1 polynucleotide adenylyltransferase [Helicobacter ibis]